MNEAVSTIGEAIVQLVNAGGPYAIWAAVIVYVLPKLILGGTIVCITWLVCRLFSEHFRVSRVTYGKQISLLGSEVSQEMTDSIHGLENSVTSALRLVQSMTEETKESLEQIRSCVRPSPEQREPSEGQDISQPAIGRE